MSKSRDLLIAEQRLIDTFGIGKVHIGQANRYQRVNHGAKRWRVSRPDANGDWNAVAEGDDLIDVIHTAIERAGPVQVLS